MRRLTSTTTTGSATTTCRLRASTFTPQLDNSWRYISVMTSRSVSLATHAAAYSSQCMTENDMISPSRPFVYSCRSNMTLINSVVNAVNRHKTLIHKCIAPIS